MILPIAATGLWVGSLSGTDEPDAAWRPAPVEVSQGTEVPPLSETEQRHRLWKVEVQNLGAHWSGLDRYALLLAFDGGDVGEARRLISAAAASTGEPDSEARLIIELYSTDVFAPFSEQLRDFARAGVNERRRSRGAARASDARQLKAEFLDGYISEHLLGDDEGARASYQRVVATGRARRDATPDDVAMRELAEGTERMLEVVEHRARRDAGAKPSAE